MFRPIFAEAFLHGEDAAQRHAKYKWASKHNSETMVLESQTNRKGCCDYHPMSLWKTLCNTPT
eukprot:3227406-Amphidinium_carterae.1